MKRFLLIVILSCLVFGSGCQSLGTYFKDRALDLADCFRADVGFGPGFGVDIHLTDALSVGVGGSYMYKAGLKGRYVGCWQDVHYGFPIANIMWYNTSGPRLECLGIIVWNMEFIGCEHYSFSGECQLVEAGYVNWHFFGLGNWQRKSNHNLRYSMFEDITSFDIEIGVAAGAVGARIGFSPGQFADFILGWFGIDIGNDDTATEPEKPETND